jgi:hypothetical protein
LEEPQPTPAAEELRLHHPDVAESVRSLLSTLHIVGVAMFDVASGPNTSAAQIRVSRGQVGFVIEYINPGSDDTAGGDQTEAIVAYDGSGASIIEPCQLGEGPVRGIRRARVFGAPDATGEIGIPAPGDADLSNASRLDPGDAERAITACLERLNHLLGRAFIQALSGARAGRTDTPSS